MEVARPIGSKAHHQAKYCEVITELNATNANVCANMAKGRSYAKAIPIRNVKLYWVILLAQAYILVSDLERTYVPKPDSASSMAVSKYTLKKFGAKLCLGSFRET